MIFDIRVAMDSWPGVPCTELAASPLQSQEKNEVFELFIITADYHN
jgi:hypothetical protein